MQELSPGLFLIEEDMPCPPSSLEFKRYRLFLSDKRDPDEEEAAARIIYFSQQEKRWVGVSLDRLFYMVSQDFFDLQICVGEVQSTFPQSVWVYRALCFLTLGIFALKRKNPKKQREDALNSLPRTGLYVNTSFVNLGIAKLCQRNLLRVVSRDGSPRKVSRGLILRNDVFFPTPALISLALEIQQKNKLTGQGKAGKLVSV